MKKKYDYELVPFGKCDDDAEIMIPRKYRFKEEVAEEHNRQYALNDVPKRLVRVKPRDLNNES
tara:strand:- start:238 stop:426 length:189 start_codon:yes stop_codon:yes gene_type:complete